MRTRASCGSPAITQRAHLAAPKPTSLNMSAASMSATLAVGKVPVTSRCVASRARARTPNRARALAGAFLSRTRTRERMPTSGTPSHPPGAPPRAPLASLDAPAERPSKAPRRARSKLCSPSDTHPRTRRNANTTKRKQSSTTYQLRASLLVLRRVHDESRRFASAVDASACLGLGQKHPSHEESRTVVSHHTQRPPLFALSMTTRSRPRPRSRRRRPPSTRRRSTDPVVVVVRGFKFSTFVSVALRVASPLAGRDGGPIQIQSRRSRRRRRSRAREGVARASCRVVLRVARTYPRRADALGARKKT